MITFRDADEADLPAVVAMLADDKLGGRREEVGPPLPPEYGAGFRAMMAHGGRIVLAMDDDAVVGCLQLDILYGVSQLGMARAQVEGVRVASSRRGHGIGGLLMQEAIRRAKAAGARSMQLTTNAARTDAQRFYEALGFVRSHVGMKLSLSGS
jgi:GNAT superfamily N-acetyltransferase